MESLLFSSPDGSLPKIGTQAAKLLNLVKHGEKIEELMLADIFESNQRSPIQDLGSDNLLNWLIHPIENDRGKIIARQLDIRHLCGCPKLDSDARKERRKQLKERSYQQAKQGRIREPKSKQECAEAIRDYFLSFGDAANDAILDKKKPTED
jgi:hypothetical protein